MNEHLQARWSIGLICAALVFGGGANAAAQVTTGNVTGSVSDCQGGWCPAPLITLASATRGTSIDAQTNQNGDFLFPNVTADTYTVKVTLEGFKTLERQNIAVSPGDRVAVGTLTLEVGGMAETVTVAGRGAAHSGQQRRAIVHGHHRGGAEPADQHPQLGRLHLADAGRRRDDAPGQRRHAEQHLHDRRRRDHGHRQQRPDAAAQRRRHRRGEGPDAPATRRSTAASGMQITGRDQERHQPVPRLGLRHRAQLRLELEHLGRTSRTAIPKTVSKQRDWGYTLGGPDRQAGRQQQAVLLLRARVPPAHDRRRRSGGSASRRCSSARVTSRRRPTTTARCST